MSETSTPAKRQKAAPESREAEGRREQTNLSFRYGTIGIEAVAAAARYSSLGQKTVHATAPRIDQRFVESAS